MHPSRLALMGLALVIIVSGFSAVPAAAAPSESAASPRASVTIDLHGAIQPTNGWGFTSATISQPGPQINVNQGDVVTFRLFAADGIPHILVIDLNANGVQDTGEPASPQFSSATVPVVWNWTANQAGTMGYLCGIHGASQQRGTLVVAATGQPPAGDSTLLIVGGIVVVVIIVAVAAMMLRKKPKAPEPPAQP